jgi:hypothetical protein
MFADFTEFVLRPRGLSGRAFTLDMESTTAQALLKVFICGLSATIDAPFAASEIISFVRATRSVIETIFVTGAIAVLTMSLHYCYFR